MKSIAIIPARGGSKRLPKKNVMDFYGKPMIAWTIEAAIESNVFDKVLVSTDDKETAAISIEIGAEVPFLRTEATDDKSQVPQATLAALKQAEEHWGDTWDYVYQLLPNCPLRGSNEIQDVNKLLGGGSCEAVMTCFDFGWMNPWWAFELDKESRAKELFPNNARDVRSQDNPKLFCVSGAIWAAKTESFKRNNSFYMENRKYLPIGWQKAMDIDEEQDLLMAKVIKEMENASR